jgi:hypothetical protein
LPASLLKTSGTSASLAEKEKEDDNWDNDFEEGISVFKIAGPSTFLSCQDYSFLTFQTALERDPADQTREVDDNSDTIRPTQANLPPRTPKADESMSPILEDDFSDLVGDEDTFQGRVASLRVRAVISAPLGCLY